MSSSFLAASRPADFIGVGRRYVVSRCFLYWAVDTRASGTIMFGKPLEADIAEMQTYWHRSEDKRFKGRAVFIDARGVESVDALAFKKLLDYLVGGRKRPMDEAIGSMTLVHTEGLVGVITAGLLKIVRPPYRFQTVSGDHCDEGFVTAGVGDLFESVEQLRLNYGRAADISRAVQAVLQKKLNASADEIADELGISSRTLQRRLDAVKTSLRAERQRQLMLNAEELLGATDLDLDAIASRLGLASASHLVTHFKRTHGLTPGEWRERNKR